MEEGDLVKLNCFKNGKDEAIGISDEIEKKLKKNIHLIKFSSNIFLEATSRLSEFSLENS